MQLVREVRRLQVVGRRTFAVTLPKEWVEELGWAKGMPVVIERLPDGSLRVAAAQQHDGENRGANSELVIDASRLAPDPGSLVRMLVSGYIAGFDTIRVVFPVERRGVVEEARRIAESIMIGFVAVEETSNSIVFQNVADAGRMDLMSALSRQARVAYSMVSDVALAASESDVRRLRLVVERDQVVDRLYLYVARQLSLALQGRVPAQRLGLLSSAETLHYIVASKSIERVADHASILARKLEGFTSGGEGMGELSMLLREAADLFKQSADSLIKLDVGLASLSAHRGETLRDMIDSMLRGGHRVPAYMLENVKRIVGYSLDISEAAIDVAVLRGGSSWAPQNPPEPPGR